MTNVVAHDHLRCRKIVGKIADRKISVQIYYNLGISYVLFFVQIVYMSYGNALARHTNTRKPTICICEIKGADQLRSNSEANQRLCSSYMDSSTLYIRNFQSPAIVCDCTCRVVSDLFENHIVGFPTKRLIYKCGGKCKEPYRAIGSGEIKTKIHIHITNYLRL